MFASKRVAQEPAAVGVGLVAVLFFCLWTATSWARWANFAYRTFDLAYYVQALWQLIHGRWEVSVQYVPLLGNHVEPIMFLFAPFFFLFRHPMLFVVIQNAALAAMGPIGYHIARQLGLGRTSSLLLACALLVAPATGYVAIHEFHPEALTAPFLLLMLQARLSGSLVRHWIWFLAVLACKENMALLLVAYGAVHCVWDRKLGRSVLLPWFIWPMAVAAFWFVLCSKVITPAFNSGNIDYLALYERLGSSGTEILHNAVTKPQLILSTLGHALTHGNLVWGILLPFLCLPILRPKWLLIATPVLLQHLLSWRTSEWTIYFHYAAPLLPLWWMATAETAAFLARTTTPSRIFGRALPALVLLGCLAGEIVLGPANGIIATGHEWVAGKADRARKLAFISAIPPDASVVAPLPYLSHLATRRELHSLHYILKGLKTLSRVAYEPPPPTEYVLIDYRDSATFDGGAGFYHPRMRALGGRIIPSSEQLLNNFLRPAEWESRSVDELTLLRRRDRVSPPSDATGTPVAEFDRGTKLIKIEKSYAVISRAEPLKVTTVWEFGSERDVYPWMALQFVDLGSGAQRTLVRGICAPGAREGQYEETWEISPGSLAPGHYTVRALFFDNAKAAWSTPGAEISTLGAPLSLGELEVEAASSLP